MNLILVILYLLILWFIFSRVPFYKNSGIDSRWFAIILLAKFLAALAYNWIQKHYYQVGDTFAFFDAGHELMRLIWTDPSTWFKLTFGPSGIELSETRKEIVSRIGFWNDSSAYMMVRINSLLALISNQSHAVMLAAWQIIPITGMTAIYRVSKDIFPDKAELLKYALFFFPSLLFWSAGIHKEALVMLSIGLILYSVHYFSRLNISKSLCLLLIFSILLLVLRDYIFAAFMPALLSYGLIRHKWTRLKKPLFLYLGILAFLFIATVVMSLITPRFDLFAYLSETQAFFLKHNSGLSNFNIVQIDGSIGNFLVHSPRAFISALFNPDIFDIESKNIILRFLSVLENLVLLAFIAWVLLKNKIETMDQRNFLWLSVIFSVCLLTLLGLVVNNLGALYRYKSNLLPLLIPALVCISFLQLPFKRKSETNIS